MSLLRSKNKERMARLDLQKNWEMHTYGRWAEGRGQEWKQTVANKKSRDRGQGSYAEAKTIDKVSRSEYCKTVWKNTGLKKKKTVLCLTPRRFLVI